jgi:hypothetical protein
MPPRKGKGKNKTNTPLSKVGPEPSKISDPKDPQNDSATPKSVSKKRKIDWADIGNDFGGFDLKSVRQKATKKRIVAQASKKQKTVVDNYKDKPLGADIIQENPFAGSSISDTHYAVTPAAEWESTSRYRKFTSK